MQWARAGFFPFDYIHVPSIVFIAIVERHEKAMKDGMAYAIMVEIIGLRFREFG